MGLATGRIKSHKRKFNLLLWFTAIDFWFVKRATTSNVPETRDLAVKPNF